LVKRLIFKTSLLRWQRLTRCIVSITIAVPANLSGSHYHARRILLRLLAKPVHFAIRKSAKVRNACKPTKKF